MELVKLMQRDDRKYPRFGFTEKVLSQGRYFGVGIDLSLGGCFIETKSKGLNFSDISFPLVVLPRIRKEIRIQVEPMWSSSKGVGAKFNLNDDNRTVLSQWEFIKKLEEMEIEP